MAEKIWFVTGASRGFGRLWTEAALARGDKVVATARDTAVLSDLSLTNAGYGLMGALEETTIEEARANFDANVFGTFSTIKAALPLLRAQRRGHLLAVSSVGGLVTFPMASIYQATKFAVEGLIASLAQEVAGFEIKVTLIEPGPFKTDFISSTSLKNTRPIPAYDAARDQAARMLTPEMFGDPKTTSGTILRVVDAEEPPLHVILGSLLPLVKQVYAARIQSWKQWDDSSGRRSGRVSPNSLAAPSPSAHNDFF